MTNGIKSLSYAVRLNVLAKYLGLLALMTAVMVLAPLIVSLIYGDLKLTFRYLIIIIILFALFIPCYRLKTPDYLQVNEALTIAALAFLISPLIMTYPMMDMDIRFIDALFETVSAITTTGLTTIGNASEIPKTFLFGRAWMQWYGGLGIAVLSVAFLMGHHVTARKLAETPHGGYLATTIQTHARRILIIYFTLTAIGCLILWLLVQDGFIALTHVLSAVSTGGFSPLDNSLAGLDNWSARYTVIALALCGAIPLPLYYHIWHNGWREVINNPELKALLCISFIVICLLTVFMDHQSGLRDNETVAHAILLGLSAQTTAGFTSLEISGLDNASKAVLIISMILGGGVGSTAGGIKILRLLIVLRMIQLLIQRTALPSHAVTAPHLGNKPLENKEIEYALLLILLFLIVIAASWFVFIAFGYMPLDALFEVVSATATVGLSTGITNAELHPVLKCVLCMDMLLGRLEIVSLLVVMYPPTWFGRRMEAS